MYEVDLHLHTTASDGRLKPSELVGLIAKRGIRFAAITDHDSTEGLSETFEAAQAFPELAIIPGIELSSDIPGKEVHILGYFLDYSNKEFQATLKQFRVGRVERARLMVEKLSNLGLPVEWDRVIELADGAVGRPHIAQAMVEKGYISVPQDAFIEYLGRNGRAYVQRPKLTPEEAVEMIRKVGGSAVLAHPIEVGELSDLETILPSLRDAGLDGIEVYYGNYSEPHVSFLQNIAEKYNLVACGGSDYHAFSTPNEVEPGDIGPPREALDLLTSHNKNHL